ncbi:MAG: NAD(P)/FAD-dependent oxidoreductase [Roseofilum sp. SBFL]|uniref:NAD(P)/FAD-dependent oxidoreductase n=1 Tax=unclassified Roseofilum TaxID=2620099 RepID=UPI001B17F550|nr:MULTISPECIES: NAD(P)/FAD-dependent oxidoreductase [unclassified Roseofilum]MBP0014091.1 NAD(P)/FAD-dependent oxidoreductase [Roseofilum sp. SID3]MBP0026716.1 NAD(P)/FAD-dependent oxidoreductase [Roseofilum sp. SID2]MBP0044880.1 NAD(P)/FAD-dependent oxidoreductase [Roseofilum sp. SBFL]
MGNDGILIIGGGAAGFFAAISCKTAHPQTEVTLLEAGKTLLSKLLISGGGRCNVTHACFDPAALVQSYPRGAKALRGAFTRFQPSDTIAWFESHGVSLKTERDGRMFPVTNDSQTIADCLIQQAKTLGVEIHTRSPVLGVNAEDRQFRVQVKSGQELLEMKGDRLLFATGSHPSGYQLAQRLGHTVVPPVPSLFTFKINDDPLRELTGISVTQARVDLPELKLSQTGPVLITHWGLSGPAILKLSAWGARDLKQTQYQAPLRVNWLPQSRPDDLRQLLLKVKSQLGAKNLWANCPVPIPRRLWQYLLEKAGIGDRLQWAQFSKTQLNKLLQTLTQDHYQISGKGIFKEEFVTCGGIPLKEVNFKTLESRCCPGLHFAGEILDIDGITGGFNFQNAWTTGWLAGQGMIQE